ncbi:hypothetical protein HOLleu_14653 [Holothuria leucospilota]|uniref:Uncharacterized protein n=1 Tax=Holothuria leucospilota TaxID=206669 RepID=A0A9Q1HCN5_HOLLE|nr:hypothetical protein HOLleu_14653 [Holothuria leucospilota]
MTRQEHRIESIDERMESSREFNFNAAFLELSRRENCLRGLTTLLHCLLPCIQERSRNCWTVYTRSFC